MSLAYDKGVLETESYVRQCMEEKLSPPAESHSTDAVTTRMGAPTLGQPFLMLLGSLS